MIARYAGATLGLFAFAIVIGVGLLTRNPIGVTLSRSIFALFVFCMIGLVLGSAARMVVAEHERDRESEIRKRYREKPVETEEGEPARESTTEEGGATAA